MNVIAAATISASPYHERNISCPMKSRRPGMSKTVLTEKERDNMDKPTLTYIGTLYTGELGESYTEYYLITGAEDIEAARSLFGEEHPLEAEHCQHEYDCCGQTYRRTPEFLLNLHEKGSYIVMQSAYMNI
jgi:hypothetical protein